MSVGRGVYPTKSGVFVVFLRQGFWDSGEEKGLVAMDASLGSVTDIQHPDMESSYLNNPIRNPTFRKDIHDIHAHGTLIHHFITIFFETMVS